MAKITLNDKEIEVEDGKNLVDAAKENGVEIPHYCYHPGLSIAGQCRMCVVEQEGNPKLQIACNMKCHDGLNVKTNTERVEQAVQANLEFHLINHPIDCPICDQAGECGLQDYYMKHGKYKSQMRENKVLKQKVVDLGSRIVLDKERCILCDRCVRFTNEVSMTGALVHFNRGDFSEIGTFNNRPMTDNYQVNTVDICPVGALTSKDFRFEQRVWFLDETPTVCGGCSKGCNIFTHHKKGKHVYRLKPRYNKDINGYWMCDAGRDTYKDANYDRRTTKAKLGGVEMPSQEAIQMWVSEIRNLVATERMEEIGIWLTPAMTNEELESVHELMTERFGITKYFSENVRTIKEQDRPVDGFLYRSDLYPNTAGMMKFLEEKKIKLELLETLKDQLARASLSHLIIFAPEGQRLVEDFQEIQNHLSPETFVTLVTPQQAAVDVFTEALSIPSISHLEKNGSITNCDGIEQQLNSDFRMFKDTASIQEIMDLLAKTYEKRTDSEKKVS